MKITMNIIPLVNAPYINMVDVGNSTILKFCRVYIK